MNAHALKLIRDNWERVVPVGLILVSISFIVGRIGEFPIGAFNDDAYYVEMARSIAEGRGPVIYYHPQVASQYPYNVPMGFPLLLSPIALLFPYSAAALKTLSIIATLGLIPIYWSLLKTIATKRDRIVLISLVFLNPWVITYSNRVLSDATYSFVSLAALLLYVKWLEGVKLFRPQLIFLIVMLGLCAMVRTIGLSVLIALTLHLLLTKRFRHASVLFPCVAITFVPQILINLSTGGDLVSPGYYAIATAHSSDVLEYIIFIGMNFIGYLKEMPTIMLPMFGNPTYKIASSFGLDSLYPRVLLSIGFVFIAFVSGAMIMSIFNSNTVLKVLSLYLLTYMFGLLNFSGYSSGMRLDTGNYLRYLLPILPFLYLFSLRGLQACILYGNSYRSRKHMRSETLSLGVLLLILPMSLGHNFYRLVHPLRSTTEASGRGYVDTSIGSDWVHENTSPTDVIMTLK